MSLLVISLMIMGATWGVCILLQGRRPRRPGGDLDGCLVRLRGRLGAGFRITPGPALVGELSGVRVHLAGLTLPVSDGDDVRGLRLLVRHPAERIERHIGRYTDEMGRAKLLLGDQWLDGMAHFRGPPAAVLATMNAQRRRALARPIVELNALAAPGNLTQAEALLGRRVLLLDRTQASTTIYGEILTLEPDLAAVERVVRDLVDLVCDIAADRTSTVKALITNVRQDPCAAVRLASLKALHASTVQKPGEGEHYPSAVAAALQDSDMGVRYYATTLAAPERARPVLEDLVRDVRVDAQIRRQALADCLNTRAGLRSRELRALLDHALRALALREMAQKYLSRGADENLLAEMCERSASEDDAWCLGLLGVLHARRAPADAEPQLIALLDRPTPDLRVAAAELLGKIGSGAAIDPLLAHMGDPDYDEIARAAVRTIQTRLGPVEAGRLSIAAPAGPAGALSVATEEGALSRAEDE